MGAAVSFVCTPLTHLPPGTDFQCNDDELNNSGGLHVIQTFFSKETSEETQIKGRTARQGNRGSYSLVLNKGEPLLIFIVLSVYSNSPLPLPPAVHLDELADTLNYDPSTMPMPSLELITQRRMELSGEVDPDHDSKWKQV